VAPAFSMQAIGGGAGENRLDRAFVDPVPEVSISDAVQRKDRFEVGPGVVHASPFISNLDFGPITVLY
jgi:hypothetical protein